MDELRVASLEAQVASPLLPVAGDRRPETDDSPVLNWESSDG